MNSTIVFPQCEDRRHFLTRLALTSALFAAPGAFAEELIRTPSQTEGPFYPDYLPLDTDNDLILLNDSLTPAVGEVTWLSGRILDAKGDPIRNATVEIWQCDAKGAYLHGKSSNTAKRDANFQGFGRFLTGSTGEYLFRTIKPGPYPWRNQGSDWRPAHIHVSLFGVAFAQRLVTQMYFEGDPLIPLCPILSTVPNKDGIEQLVAKLDMANMVPFDCLVYRFDMVLRGRRQTFFENKPEGH